MHGILLSISVIGGIILFFGVLDAIQNNHSPFWIWETHGLPDIVRDDGIYQVSLNYYNSEIPSFADKSSIESGISKAMRMWDNSSPQTWTDKWGIETQLKFEYVGDDETGRGEIVIILKKDPASLSGENTHLKLCQINAMGGKGSLIECALGNYDCKGNWKQYSSDTIADGVAHELGHYLGIGHTRDKSHLMYGERSPMPEYPFDDLGFNIPHQNSQFVKWIAYEKLEPRYNQLQKQYDQFPQTATSHAQYDQAMQIYNELNKIIDEMNCIAQPDPFADQ
jgi:hypothetical protein